MSDTPLTHSDNQEPTAFTQAQLEWLPWLPPLPEDELTDRHCAGLVDAARAKSPYFRLLARDPDTLGARTRSDKDIFYNPDAGLPRAERQLSATPSDFGPEHIDGLRAVGLDDYAIADALQGAAFFNWANRLMLSLGEPQLQVGG